MHYLLSSDQAKVAEANETLFDDLVAAWENAAFDPARTSAASGPISATGPWRLARLEASGFGGINLTDGPPLVVLVNGENWCLEGQNGSGKTALASAILWALTGYRCRDQEGLIFEQGTRTPVHSDLGVQIGDWPAIVAYPPSPAKLAGTADTWVRLTFHNPDGDSVDAYRRLVAAPGANPVIEATIAPELLVAPQLLEVGLLMPARLGRIGFGGRSETIYEAVKLLTGLDQLAAIADGASNFGNMAKRFMKYAADNGKTVERLPHFTHNVVQRQGSVSAAARELAKNIGDVEHISALVGWWHTHREQFGSAWNELKGVALEGGDFPAASLEGKLGSLEAALEKATPLDDLAKALNDAATDADKWLPIQEMQRVREAIREALNPLKDLRLLVASETARSISSLSARMKAILERIHFRERLSYEDATLNKKTVQISGSFDHGIRIDASTVANSSWLRAILWAFVLALREQTIETAADDPFPLMVLDDPQSTFDPRNKRKWAEEIARLGNADPASSEAAQVLVITHERQFFQMLVNMEKLTGQQGLIVRLCDVSKVATIIYGDCLARAYQDAIDLNNDEKGHAYVLKVRTYCEELLRIMLRAEGPKVCDMALDRLVDLMKHRRDGSVPPFTNPSFGKLLNLIGGGGGGKPMKLINDVHHRFDGTIGVAQATDVRAFWEEQLQSLLHTCFKIFAEFEAYAGEPRLFAWMDNVVQLPAGNAAEMKKLHFRRTCIAAAARTDGRAGDGLIMVTDLSQAQEVMLYNHDAYQLAAGTLDPVADIGDVIVVSNYAKVHARNLVVVPFEHQLLARRYNETEIHPHIAVLTGQATDPTAIAQPVIAPRERIVPRKIVGTLFAKSRLPVPPRDDSTEFVTLPDLSVVRAMLQDANLFQVSGRSAEPIALDGQFIVTKPIDLTATTIAQMDGRLVIAVDENGARYFKRFRPHGALVVLESLNPDGTSPAELLSLHDEQGFPRLTTLLEVVGILFELP